MFMIAKMNEVAICIKFYMTFHVLVAIDNILVESFNELQLLETLDEPLYWKRKSKDVPFMTLSWKLKSFNAVWQIIDFFSDSFYFHYFPFLVNFIPYIF